MRIAHIILAALLLSGTLLSQTVNTEQDERKQNLSRFTAALQGVKKLRPIQKKLEETYYTLKLEKDFEPLTSDSTAVLTRMVHSFLSRKEVLLPEKFLSMKPCEQTVVLEVMGSVYSSGLLWGEQKILSDAELKVLNEYSDMSTIPEDPSEEDIKLLSGVVNKFEEVATNNVDVFADAIFGSCSKIQIENIFEVNLPTEGKETWIKWAKERIHQKFEFLKIQISQ